MTGRIVVGVDDSHDSRREGIDPEWGSRRQALSRHECFARLAQRTTGRLAISAAALPSIIVVRYYLAGETILFDIGLPTLARKTIGQVVAFESGSSDADHADDVWSVCAVGVVEPAVEASWEDPTLQVRPELVTGWAHPIRTRTARS